MALEGHPALLTEAPHNPQAKRERMAQAMFETLSVPAVHVAIQAVLLLYASGLAIGIVLDFGDGVSRAVPICDGYALPHAIQRLDSTGGGLDEYVMRTLTLQGRFVATADGRDIVRIVKEKTCYIALDIGSDVTAAVDNSGTAMNCELPGLESAEGGGDAMLTFEG